jgi:hypothetical protein
MKNLAEIVTENKSKGEWCLWDYKDSGVREILVWKGNGKDQSQVSDIDEKGFELMNVTFEDVIKYCEEHKKDEVDKWHLDFSNAKWDKIKDLF